MLRLDRCDLNNTCLKHSRCAVGAKYFCREDFSFCVGGRIIYAIFRGGFSSVRSCHSMSLTWNNNVSFDTGSSTKPMPQVGAYGASTDTNEETAYVFFLLPYICRVQY